MHSCTVGPLGPVHSAVPFSVSLQLPDLKFRGLSLSTSSAPRPESYPSWDFPSACWAMWRALLLVSEGGLELASGWGRRDVPGLGFRSCQALSSLGFGLSSAPLRNGNVWERLVLPLLALGDQA